MAIAAAPARARPGRAGPAQPRAAGADALPRRRRASVYDSGDYPRCLEEALRLAGYDELRERQAQARAEGRLLGIGLACVVEPSVSNMGYITLAQTPEERALGLPKSGNAEGVTIIIGPHGGVTVRFTTTPQGQGHRTVAAQVAADVLGLEPGGHRRARRGRHRGEPVARSARATTRRRFAAVGAGAVHRAAEELARRLRAIAAPIAGVRARGAGARRRARARRRPARARGLAAPARGRGALEPGGPARRASRPASRSRSPFGLPPRAARRRRPRQLLGAPTASSPTSRVVEVDPETGRGRGARLHHRARRRPHPQPADRRGPDPRRPGPRRSAPRC